MWVWVWVWVCVGVGVGVGDAQDKFRTCSNSEIQTYSATQSSKRRNKTVSVMGLNCCNSRLVSCGVSAFYLVGHVMLAGEQPS